MKWENHQKKSCGKITGKNQVKKLLEKSIVKITGKTN